MSRRYRLVTFDLDGTLVDTATEIAQAANGALDDFRLPPQPLDRITRCIGNGGRELMRRLAMHALSEHPLRAAQLRPEALFERFEVHYAASAGRASSPYPGARETLDRLAVGGVRLACVTNKERRFAERVLEASGLADRLELLLGGDSLPQRKPHPSVLGHVLDRFGCAADEAAHVGDSRIDVETAKGAGVAAWAVPWGYNGGEPIAAAGPHRLFASLPEIASFVLGADRSCAAAAR